MANRKIIVVACIVNIWLYRSDDSTLPSGPASCTRISSASTPPTRKKTIAAVPYMIPIFLWSTVNSHERQPVVWTGRRNVPYVDEAVTGAGSATTASVGRSTMAISVSATSVPAGRR